MTQAYEAEREQRGDDRTTEGLAGALLVMVLTSELGRARERDGVYFGGRLQRWDVSATEIAASDPVRQTVEANDDYARLKAAYDKWVGPDKARCRLLGRAVMSRIGGGARPRSGS